MMADQMMEIMIAALETDDGKWIGAFRIVINSSEPSREPGMDSVVQCVETFATREEALQHARQHADEYTKLCIFLGIIAPEAALVDFSTINYN
jgi:hypothetical protein